MTNADRIRAMTDEEIAEYLSQLEIRCYLRIKPKWKFDTEAYAQQWLDYLTEETDKYA